MSTTLKGYLKRVSESKEHRKRFTIAAAVMTAYVLAMAGIFSYFTSSDTVTNRLEAGLCSMALYEPKWDREGQFMAAASEPGMNIPKDPYGYNDGETDMYCRIKMTVSVTNDYKKSTGTEHLYTRTTDNEVRALNAKEKICNIINVIYYDDNNSTRLLEDTSKSNGFAAKLNNPAFVLYGTPIYEPNKNNSDYSTESENSVLYGGSVTYYFYYKGDNSGEKMKLLHPGEQTERLFNFVNIPIYKKDYLAAFDLGYSITLQAEGLPAALFEDGDPTPQEFADKITDSE